ncbi:MAG: hypothetical protein ABSE62_00360 [Chthoniobacteraceae bacterium]|jgi:type II secretory pathway pseudopilin PulG
MTLRISRKFKAFTLIECVMAMISVGAVGLAILYTLFSGFLLFTKNTAMNVSHEEARVALIQLQQDLHTAVSLPELTDSACNIYTSGTFQGPAAGVEFQVLVDNNQYCAIAANVTLGSSTVTVGLPSGYPTPNTAMRLIVPAYTLESNLSAVSVSGTVATCTLSGTTCPNNINVTGNNVVAFFTQRVYYWVTTDPNLPNMITDRQGDTSPALQLNYQGVNRNKTYVMAASGIEDTQPFSIPNTNTGAPQYNNVVAVGLSAVDVGTTALITRFGFNTSSIMLSGSIPAYSQLTFYQ